MEGDWIRRRVIKSMAGPPSGDKLRTDALLGNGSNDGEADPAENGPTTDKVVGAPP